MYQGADPTKVHFIQADLQNPPLTPASLDLIHSAGVLHHTADTHKTFRTLCRLLRPGGTFYVWLYKYERSVTPAVNSIRNITTRIPGELFAKLARVMAPPFIGFCVLSNALGIRQYSRVNRREAALALMDIFGAPYAHYHSLDEVADWYRREGFREIWSCNNGRRGFGVCGRLPSS
jgi:SAM-dependent methyltransferase